MGEILIQAALFHRRTTRTSGSVLTMNSAVRTAEDWEGMDRETDLTELRQTVDNAQPNFVTNLHLYHFGRETGAHTLGVF